MTRLAAEVLLGKLEALDVSVRRAHGPLLTLDPGRADATPFRVLGVRAVRSSADARTLAAYGDALLSVVEALCANFPALATWDLDFFAARLLGEARTAERGAEACVVETGELVVGHLGALSVLGGGATRHASDFLYGFAWARWVREDPGARADVGPFDDAFLAEARERSRALAGALTDGEVSALASFEDAGLGALPREHELRLHRDLAARGYVPVAAWNASAVPTWNRPYQAIREARAHALT